MFFAPFYSYCMDETSIHNGEQVHAFIKRDNKSRVFKIKITQHAHWVSELLQWNSTAVDTKDLSVSVKNPNTDFCCHF